MAKLTTALNYIKNTTLPLIDGTGSYNNDLTSNALISRDYRHPDNVESFPALFVLGDGPAQWTPLTAQGYTTGGSQGDISSGYPVRILSYVKLAEPGSLEITGLLTDAMDDLFSDILIATHSDRSLGGNVHAITLLGSDLSLERWEDRIGILEMWFALKWDIDPSAGTV